MKSPSARFDANPKADRLRWASRVLRSTVESDPLGPQVTDSQRIEALRVLVDSGRLQTYVPLLPLLFNLNGKPYTLDDHFPFEPLYGNTIAESLVVKSGRQVAKSTNQASRGLLITNVIPYFTTLYVTPLYEQVRKFSTEYVAKFIEESPLKHLWTGTNTVNSVLHRSFKNFSKMYFSFAGTTADRIRGISAKMVCFDKDAEVLTRAGWKPVREVGTDDEVADVNEKGEVEWNRPTRVVRQLHTGEMVTFRHRGFRLRVTGDHKMWANFKVKPSAAAADAYQFVSAAGLARTGKMGFKFTSAVSWPDEPRGRREFEPVPGAKAANRRPLELPYEAFAELMGWYLAEGHLAKSDRFPKLCVTQNAGRHADRIEDCLRRCGLTYSVGVCGERRAFKVNAVHLGLYARPLGLARDKYIPDEFFRDRRLLEPLLKALYLGDACYHEGEEWDHGTLRTRSRRLAEDAQRAWLALGRPAVIHTRSMPPNPESPPEPLYEVCAYKRDYQVYWRADFARKNRVAVEHVDGEEVYCFTVKNHRPVVKGDFGSLPVVCGQCFDEVQDLDPNHLPVIRETMSHSEYGTGVSVYTGTPKALDNTLEYEWQRSSQAEWMIPCHRCGKENYPNIHLDLDRMIGPWHEGIGPLHLTPEMVRKKVKAGVPAVVCASPKCGGWIDPRRGRWVHKIPKLKFDYPGYHIPQIIMPIHCENQRRWSKLLAKRNGAENYTTAKFYNEVLGESYDVGAKLLSETDLKRAACLPWRNDPKSWGHQVARVGDYVLRVLGVDWGGGGDEEVSFTTAAVLGVRADGRMDVVYGERLLTPHDPRAEARRLLQIYNAFQCQILSHDYNGAGSLRELLLVNSGMDVGRVVPLVYNRTASKDLLVPHFPGEGSNSRRYWILDKARSLQYLSELVRICWVRFFQYDFVDVDNRGLLRDFLSLVEHKTETARAGEVYNIHRVAAFPDDFAHSVNFALCAACQARGDWPNISLMAGLMLSSEQEDAWGPPNPWTGPQDLDPFLQMP